ncbi:MAG: peptidylprolyl isomerase [Pirellulales bacterium]
MLQIEPLEARWNLHAPTDHIHAHLAIFLDGQQVTIPALIGVPATGNQHLGAANPHTHDASGTLHIGEGAPAGTGTEIRLAKLDDFFDVWREKALLAGNNPIARFDSTHLLDRTADANHVVRMYVNGKLNTEFENYIPEDGDQIVLSYESAVSAETPQFAPLENQRLFAGSPLWLPIDGFDESGQDLTYTVTSSDPNLVAASVYSGTTGLRMTVTNFGEMEFRLFDDLVPRPANRVKTLADQGFYDGITFHRVVNNGVIQAGDPTATGTGGSTLGTFDDQFHVDLQHNRTGMLSFAKLADDSNNSQFFVTEGPQRTLDFQHSLFGVLVEGENTRDQISNVVTDANSQPRTNVTIQTAASFVDRENGVIQLKATEGASGTADITVTVRDPDNHTLSRTFRVTVTPDTMNGGPFLNDLPPIRTSLNTPATFTLTSQDVEGNQVTYLASASGSVTSVVAVQATTGVVTATPPAGFIGTMQVWVAVAAAPGQPNHTYHLLDTQVIPIIVAPGAPTEVDLLDAWDSGRSSSDNITNSTASLQFLVNGVANGAVVELRSGHTVIGSATATGSTVVIAATTALLEGTSAITATQTLQGLVSDPSTPLDVIVDTLAPDTMTFVPPSAAGAGVEFRYDFQHPEEQANGEGVHYSLKSAPAGATIDPPSGVLTWTPTALQVGTHGIEVTFTDAAGNSRSQTLSVTVNDALSVTFDVSSLVESGAPAIGTARVSNSERGTPIVVSLSSSNIADATVPAEVIIPAGQSSVNFTVSAIDNTLRQGHRTVTITAMANGYPPVQRSLDLLDDETLFPWHNSQQPEDVNHDGTVAPVDALHVINEINENGSRTLPVTVETPSHFLDVSQDGNLGPIDALIVITFLNFGESSEGEAEPAAEPDFAAPRIIGSLAPLIAQAASESPQAASAPETTFGTLPESASMFEPACIISGPPSRIPSTNPRASGTALSVDTWDDVLSSLVDAWDGS